MKHWATEYLKTANVARSMLYGALGTAGGALAGGALGSVLGTGTGVAAGDSMQHGIEADPNMHLPPLDQHSMGLHTPIGDVNVSHDDLTPFMRGHPSVLPGMLGAGGLAGGMAGGAGAGALMGGMGGLALGARPSNRQDQM